jgi:hypothetical protein
LKSVLEFEILELYQGEDIVSVDLDKEEFKKSPFESMKEFTFTCTLETVK